MKFPIGSVIMFFKLLRETSFEEIDELAQQNPRLAVVGEDDVKSRLRELLGLSDADRSFTGDETADVVLSLQQGIGRSVSVLVRNADGPAETVQISDQDIDANRMALGRAICKTSPHLAVPLGRRLQWLRPAAAEEVIRQTSMINAQVAALSNIWGIVPVVGPLIGSTADMLVLTKNQLMLVYKLAVIHAKPLGSKKMVFSEFLPILGSAFVWRTAARELAGLAPFSLGILPKVSIAFVGTTVIGLTANYYYMTGKKPPTELAKRFSREAMLQAKRVFSRKKTSEPAVVQEQPVLTGSSV